jgi:hypothetical protein
MNFRIDLEYQTSIDILNNYKSLVKNETKGSRAQILTSLKEND